MNMTDQEAMRAFWDGMGVSEDTGICMMQDLGLMDASGSLTELGVAFIEATVRKEPGSKPR
jgi:hypothetical protein